MRNLIKHLLKNNFAEIVEKSLLNCHVKGLHSIMLLESPGKTIRLYIAVPGNTLENNFPAFRKAGKDMSLAFHAHHCNLTLECIKGDLLNWTAEKSDIYAGFTINKYKYQSKINSGKMSFEFCGLDFLKTKKHWFLSPGDCVFMPANEIHTVACDPAELTAWLVYEGESDPNYIPYSYSPNDLNNIDASELYIKPTPAEILTLMKQCDLIDDGETY